MFWLDEHDGSTKFKGQRFDEIKIYKDNAAHFVGLVNMPALKPLFLLDFKEKQSRRLAYTKAISSPDFNIMNQQRLVIIRCMVWQQLDRIL